MSIGVKTANPILSIKSVSFILYLPCFTRTIYSPLIISLMIWWTCCREWLVQSNISFVLTALSFSVCIHAIIATYLRCSIYKPHVYYLSLYVLYEFTSGNLFC